MKMYLIQHKLTDFDLTICIRNQLFNQKLVNYQSKIGQFHWKSGFKAKSDKTIQWDSDDQFPFQIKNWTDS